LCFDTKVWLRPPLLWKGTVPDGLGFRSFRVDRDDLTGLVELSKRDFRWGIEGTFGYAPRGGRHPKVNINPGRPFGDVAQRPAVVAVETDANLTLLAIHDGLRDKVPDEALLLVRRAAIEDFPQVDHVASGESIETWGVLLEESASRS